MNDSEVAWAAGLFEGEGCISRSGGGQNPVCLRIKMTDMDVLARFQRIMGGKIYGPYMYKLSRKPLWEWVVGSWKDVIRITDLMLPYLASRRTAKIKEIMAFRPEFPRGTLCCPAKPIASGRGYDRHRHQGSVPCDICRESLRMYFRERNHRAKLRRTG